MNETGLKDNAAAAEPLPATRPNWTVAHAFGELVWLMTQSAAYRHYSLADLEWLLMPALLLQQYRVFHEGQKPVGAIIWARLDAETGARMQEKNFRLRPDQWRNGAEIWIIELIAAPTPNPNIPSIMIEDFKKNLFPDVPVKMRRPSPTPNTIEIIEFRKAEPAIH